MLSKPQILPLFAWRLIGDALCPFCPKASSRIRTDFMTAAGLYIWSSPASRRRENTLPRDLRDTHSPRLCPQKSTVASVTQGRYRPVLQTYPDRLLPTFGSRTSAFRCRLFRRTLTDDVVFNIVVWRKREGHWTWRTTGGSTESYRICPY